MCRSWSIRHPYVGSCGHALQPTIHKRYQCRRRYGGLVYPSRTERTAWEPPASTPRYSPFGFDNYNDLCETMPLQELPEPCEDCKSVLWSSADDTEDNNSMEVESSVTLSQRLQLRDAENLEPREAARERYRQSYRDTDRRFRDRLSRRFDELSQADRNRFTAQATSARPDRSLDERWAQERPAFRREDYLNTYDPEIDPQFEALREKQLSRDADREGDDDTPSLSSTQSSCVHRARDSPRVESYSESTVSQVFDADPLSPSASDVTLWRARSSDRRPR